MSAAEMPLVTQSGKRCVESCKCPAETPPGTHSVTGTGALTRVSRGRGHWHTLAAQSWAEHGTLCRRRRFGSRKRRPWHPEPDSACQRRRIGRRKRCLQHLKRCVKCDVSASKGVSPLRRARGLARRLAHLHFGGYQDANLGGYRNAAALPPTRLPAALWAGPADPHFGGYQDSNLGGYQDSHFGGYRNAGHVRTWRSKQEMSPEAQRIRFVVPKAAY